MSLKEIAARTGTSVATVSRVLNHPGHTCHTPGLAEKIWETAHELNYLPNSSARRLRLGDETSDQPFTVDFFLTRFDSVDQDPFFGELFQHLKEELLQKNCLAGTVLSTVDITKLTGSNVHPEPVPYRPADKVIAEQGSHPAAFISNKENTGLIILGKCPPELIPLLKKRYSCIAGIDRNPTDYEYDEVICSGTTAAQTAVEYLISLGHHSIAYIGDCTYESRYTGFYQALMNHKISLDYKNIHPTSQTRREGREVMDAILEHPDRPTAIFCANDCTALGVLDSLNHTKKRGYFPSIISIDNINDSQKTSPMLTTIDIPKKEMAHLALMLLVDRQKKAHREAVRIELPCRLIIRESCNSIG